MARPSSREGEDAGRHLHIFDRPTNYFLTPEVLGEADRLFDQAEKAAASDERRGITWRRPRLGLRYVELVRKPDAKVLDEFLADLPKP